MSRRNWIYLPDDRINFNRLQQQYQHTTTTIIISTATHPILCKQINAHMGMIKRPSTTANENMSGNEMKEQMKYDKREEKKNGRENWKLRRKKIVRCMTEPHNWFLFRFKFIATLPLCLSRSILLTFLYRNDARHMVASCCMHYLYERWW